MGRPPDPGTKCVETWRRTKSFVHTGLDNGWDDRKFTGNKQTFEGGVILVRHLGIRSHSIPITAMTLRSMETAHRCHTVLGIECCMTAC